MTLHYDYTASKAYAKQIGLTWLGDDFLGLINMDSNAFKLDCTQEQVDNGMRHHMWQVKWLFTPSNYCWYKRLGIAVYFLTGLRAK